MPHWTPPLVPPLPTRVCHRTSPRRSGSRAKTTPDFCPASSTSRPFGNFSIRTDDPKSKSGPGQFPPLQAPLKMSPGVTCRDQVTRPVLISSASTASLMSVEGEEKLSPVLTYNRPRFISRVGDDHTPAPDGPQLPTLPEVFSSCRGSSRIVYVFQTCTPSL